MDAKTLSIIIAAKDEASAALAKVDESLALLARSAEEAAGKTDAALGTVDGSLKATGEAASIAADKQVAGAAKASAAAEEQASRQALLTNAFIAKQEESANSMKKTAATAALIGGATAIAIGVIAVKAAGDFQSQLSRLVTSAGESSENLGKVHDGILQISSATGTSAKDLANAMYIASSAGKTYANGGLDVVRAAAEGAKAEQADLGTVTNAVTTVMQDYGKKAGSAAMVTSTLVAAVSVGKTNFQDFTGALSAVLPTANNAGIAFTDVAAGIASMTSHGESAQQASENMADAIRHLQNPTMVMTKNLAQVGITASDLSANLGKRGVTGTMEDISKAILEHMGPDGKVLLNAFNQSKTAADDVNRAMAAMPSNVRSVAKSYADGKLSLADWRTTIKDMPGPQAALLTQFKSMEDRSRGFSDSLKGGLAQNKTYAATLAGVTGDASTFNVAQMLTNNNLGYTKAALAAVGKAHVEAGGHVQGWAQIQSTFNQQQSQARESLKNVEIVIGTALLPTATKLMKAVVDFLTPMMNWIQHNQKLATILALVIVAVLAAIVAFVAIGKTISTLTTAWKTWGEAIKVVNGIAKDNPWALVLMVIIVIVLLVITHWKELKKWGEEAWNGIKKAWGEAASFFDKLWQAVLGFFKKHWKVMLEIVDLPLGLIIANWSTIVKFFDGLWKDVIAVFNAVKGFIVAFFQAEWDGLVAIWNALGGFFTGVWNGLVRAIGKFAGFIKNFFVWEWNGLVNTWNGVTGFFAGLWNDLRRGLSVVEGIFTSPFKAAFNGISHLWNDTIGKLSFKAPSWVPGIGGKGFDMPKLPYLASGTDWFAGGSVMVGEQGPERVILPQGSQVVPNAVASSGGGMSGQQPFIGTLQVNIKGGVFMGNQSEAQMLAKQVYISLQQIARQHGLQANIPNIGILPV